MVEIRFWGDQQQSPSPPHRQQQPSEGRRREEEDEGVAPVRVVVAGWSTEERLARQVVGSGPLGGPTHPHTTHHGSGAWSEEEEYWCGLRIDSIKFSISVAICYGASLGGMATLTGTSYHPPGRAGHARTAPVVGGDDGR